MAASQANTTKAPKTSIQDGPSTEESRRPKASPSTGNITLTSPIGYIKSCFKSKNGTPRQPSVCSYSRAKLRLLKSVFPCPDHSLDGLAQFSHVWVLFVFHANGQDTFTKAKVKPPRLNGRKVGVFASRSPHRPNPIGLTLARLDKVEGDTLHLSGMDMIDGTPVLDVKPYVPDYDSPTISRPQDASNQSQDAYSTPQEGITLRSSHDCKDSRETILQDPEPIATTAWGSVSKLHSTYDHKDSRESLKQERISTTEEGGVITPQGTNGRNDSRDGVISPMKAPVDTMHPSDTNAAKRLRSDYPLGGEAADEAISVGGRCSADVPAGSTHGAPCDGGSGGDVRVAGWVGAPPIKQLQVRFTPSAEDQLSTFWKEGSKDSGRQLEFLRDYSEAHRAIEEILSADPRSVYRRNNCSDRLYYFTLDLLHITCWFGRDFAEVLHIQHLAQADIPEQSSS